MIDSTTNEPYEEHKLTLIKPIPRSIEVGADIKVYPGCNHNSDTCANKFTNIDNFGGYEDIMRIYLKTIRILALVFYITMENNN